jgi:hypothetical protein
MKSPKISTGRYIAGCVKSMGDRGQKLQLHPTCPTVAVTVAVVGRIGGNLGKGTDKFT